VDSIEITTTTRKLYKNKSQRLDIKAYDGHGNTFTTMEGSIIDWYVRIMKIVLYVLSN
jgi:hypothetical protein